MKDIVERYNGARVSPAPKQMLADSIAEVVRLRKLVVELEKREKHLEEMFHGWRDEARKGYTRIAELEAALNKYKEDELLLSKDGVHFRKAIDVIKEQSVRIAELEAALEMFANIEAYIDSRDMQPVYAFTERMSKAARAALKGEK